jgi:hypothetical protein
MFSWLNVLIGLVGTIIALLSILGSALVFHGTVAKTSAEIQARVIDAMEKEVDVLRGQVDELRLKVVDLKNMSLRQDQIILTVCEAMKKQGVTIKIERDVVMITSENETTSLRIRGV